MLRSVLLALAALTLIVPARAQDGSEFIVRLNRVEGQMRQLSGQVEQLQFENRTLKEQLRKFQEDVEFRFQEGQKGRGASPAAKPPAPAAEKPARRSDAFDPDADPSAPGAPRQLGSAQPPSSVELPPNRARPSGALDPDEGGGRRPLDLGAAGRGGAPAAQAVPPRDLSEAPSPPPGRTASVAATGSGDPRADYDVAYAYLIQRQYDQAEMGFRGYLQTHPRDRLVPDATYWLGETYLQRGRSREAAEQFLKVSTEHSRSAKAPDALLKLGTALAALGAKDQACATFAELERKYPAASANVRQGVDREQKRVRCSA